MRQAPPLRIHLGLAPAQRFVRTVSTSGQIKSPKAPDTRLDTRSWTHRARKVLTKDCVPGEFLPEAKFQGPWSKHQPLLTLSLGPRRQLIRARLRGHSGDGERMGRAGSGCR
ncbi:TPA: hypothetical protein BOS_20585 [Bos taurus]|nr:TPA: hypothetical protein BOS_20585 [Bos taurus]